MDDDAKAFMRALVVELTGEIRDAIGAIGAISTKLDAIIAPQPVQIGVPKATIITSAPSAMPCSSSAGPDASWVVATKTTVPAASTHTRCSAEVPRPGATKSTPALTSAAAPTAPRATVNAIPVDAASSAIVAEVALLQEGVSELVFAPAKHHGSSSTLTEYSLKTSRIHVAVVPAVLLEVFAPTVQLQQFYNGSELFRPSSSQRIISIVPVHRPMPWPSFMGVHADGDEARPWPWPAFKGINDCEPSSDAIMKPSRRCTSNCFPTTIGDVVEFQIPDYYGNLCTSTSCITIHDMCNASELRCWNDVFLFLEYEWFASACVPSAHTVHTTLVCTSCHVFDFHVRVIVRSLEPKLMSVGSATIILQRVHSNGGNLAALSCESLVVHTTDCPGSSLSAGSSVAEYLEFCVQFPNYYFIASESVSWLVTMDWHLFDFPCSALVTICWVKWCFNALLLRVNEWPPNIQSVQHACLTSYALVWHERHTTVILLRVSVNDSVLTLVLSGSPHSFLVANLLEGGDQLTCTRRAQGSAGELLAEAAISQDIGACCLLGTFYRDSCNKLMSEGAIHYGPDYMRWEIAWFLVMLSCTHTNIEGSGKFTMYGNPSSSLPPAKLPDATRGLLIDHHSRLGYVILIVLVTWPYFSMDKFIDLSSTVINFQTDAVSSANKLRLQRYSSVSTWISFGVGLWNDVLLQDWLLSWYNGHITQCGFELLHCQIALSRHWEYSELATTEFKTSWLPNVVSSVPVDGQTCPASVCITELGGTVGAMETMPFIEVVLQLSFSLVVKAPLHFSAAGSLKPRRYATVGSSPISDKLQGAMKLVTMSTLGQYLSHEKFKGSGNFISRCQKLDAELGMELVLLFLSSFCDPTVYDRLSKMSEGGKHMDSSICTVFSCMNGGVVCTSSVSNAGQFADFYHTSRIPHKPLLAAQRICTELSIGEPSEGSGRCIIISLGLHSTICWVDIGNPSHSIVIRLSYFGEPLPVAYLLQGSTRDLDSAGHKYYHDFDEAYASDKYYPGTVFDRVCISHGYHFYLVQVCSDLDYHHDSGQIQDRRLLWDPGGFSGTSAWGQAEFQGGRIVSNLSYQYMYMGWSLGPVAGLGPFGDTQAAAHYNYTGGGNGEVIQRDQAIRRRLLPSHPLALFSDPHSCCSSNSCIQACNP